MASQMACALDQEPMANAQAGYANGYSDSYHLPFAGQQIAGQVDYNIGYTGNYASTITSIDGSPSNIYDNYACHGHDIDFCNGNTLAPVVSPGYATADFAHQGGRMDYAGMSGGQQQQQQQPLQVLQLSQAIAPSQAFPQPPAPAASLAPHLPGPPVERGQPPGAISIGPLATLDGPGLDSDVDIGLGPGIPTRGSMQHKFNRCKPCAFVHTKGCGNGIECPFCHLCAQGEKKQRRKDKLEGRRRMRELRQAFPFGAPDFKRRGLFNEG
jgi:hypothetical protein